MIQKIYLVGRSWYPGNLGDNPNVDEFPEAAFTNFEDAKKAYDDLQITSSDMTKYIVEMPLGGGGEPFVIEGSTIWVKKKEAK